MLKLKKIGPGGRGRGRKPHPSPNLPSAPILYRLIKDGGNENSNYFLVFHSKITPALQAKLSILSCSMSQKNTSQIKITKQDQKLSETTGFDISAHMPSFSLVILFYFRNKWTALWIHDNRVLIGALLTNSNTTQ